MELSPELVISGIVLILFVGQWLLIKKYGKDNVDQAMKKIGLYLEIAAQAMLFVEQTLKKHPGVTDETLKAAAIQFAVDLLHSIGLKNVTEEDVEVIGGLIEAALREFKNRPQEEKLPSIE